MRRAAGRSGPLGPVAKLTPPQGGIYTSAVLLKMLPSSFDVRHIFRAVNCGPSGVNFLIISSNQYGQNEAFIGKRFVRGGDGGVVSLLWAG